MSSTKFDFDYNYDPAGTSLVAPDPYTDPIPKEEITKTHHGFTYAAKTHTPRSPRPSSRPKSRTASPEPPVQTEPTPEYLAVSQEPSSKPDDIRQHRKLLILDLNGTLVFRSPHVKKNAYQMRGAARPLRSVHRRPYLDSFTDYLFHPSTRTWLDTMVWSSAQPHSVADMTDQCFPGRKDELLAIWARDTLGLKQEDYHRKIQTTKDLAKPWKEFGEHSARSTLLLDDSPLKAHLQPWNHLCIKEYVADMRKNDVKVRESERVQEIQDAAAAEGGLEEYYSRKRKGEKKIQQFADKAAKAIEEARGLEYDQTLLAVIGILDSVKEETNVASWMRTGGLVDVPASSHSDPQRKRRNTGDPPSPTGSSEVSPRSSSPSEPPPSDSSSERQQEDTGVPLTDKVANAEAGLWFDHPGAFAYWAQRGRRALEALGIEVRHGVVTST